MADNRISTPALPLYGGCQCRALRYRIDGKPIAFYVCHCTECQKQSASGFGESLQIDAADLTLEGSFSSFVRQTASGRRMEGLFCPGCGTRILHRIEGNSQVVNIRGGTLDDASWLEPAAHLWTSSKQRWVGLPEDALVYERQPADLEEIRARWRSMTAD